MGIRLNKHKPNIYFKVRLQCGRCGTAPARGQGTEGSRSCPSSAAAFPFFLQPKKGGGISFNSTVTLTQCSEKLVQLILHEYSILPKGQGTSRARRPSGQGDSTSPSRPRRAAATDARRFLSPLSLCSLTSSG